MNLCKDCKYCKVKWWERVMFPRDLSHMCVHPKLADAKTSPVDGGKSEHPQFCHIMRDYDWLCGTDGQHFEPRSPK